MTTDPRRHIKAAIRRDAQQDMTLARYAEHGDPVDLVTAIATAQAIVQELQAEAGRVSETKIGATT